jgi:hypothetical protein
MPRRLPAALWSCLVVSWLVAQEQAATDARRSTFVRVEAADGTTVAGAVVTFVGCLPYLGEAGPHDVQQVQSDARGRVHGRLLADVCHLAWAVGPANERGERAVTRVHGWFGAGAVLTVRLGEPAAPTRVAVRGADAWAAHGPLRFFAVTQMPGLESEVHLDADGQLVLPHSPSQAIEVRTARGEPLFVASRYGDVVLPPPARVVVRVRDESGAPLADALVRHRVGRIPGWHLDVIGVLACDRWRELGRTDDEGRCSIEVPYAGDPLKDVGGGDLLLFASAPGRPALAGGVFRKALLQNDRKVASITGAEMAFTLPKQAPLVGSVAKALAGTTVHLAAVCKVWFENGSYDHDARSFQATVGTDGAFAFDDVPAELHSCRLSLVRPDGSVAGLPITTALRGRGVPPEWYSDGSQATAFTDVALSCVDPSGAPARNLVAVLAPAERPGVLLRDAMQHLVFDARGKCGLRLAAGKWLVFVCTESGWVARLFDVAGTDMDVRLEMQPLQVMRVELRDAAGKPVPGASLTLGGSTMRGTSDPLQSLLQSMRGQWTGAWTQLRTDAAGRMVIPFVPVEGVLSKVRFASPGATTDEFVLEANENWLQLTTK